MAFNFPSSPTLDQTFTSGASTYKYNGSAWIGTASVAPFDALAYNGIQINGAMEVGQELNGGVATSINGARVYVVDGWTLGSGGPQTVYGQQVAASVTNRTSIQFSLGVPNASPSVNDFVYISQPIEGWRIRQLGFGFSNASPVTLAFKVAAQRPGVYSGSLCNAPLDRSYPFNFTINASNTWEYKVITIPGDTTGNWAEAGRNLGMWLFFSLLGGGTNLGAAGSWQVGQFFGVTGTTNGIAAADDVFNLSDVILLPGIEAPSAERLPLTLRPYDQEVLTCMRYYQKIGFEGNISLLISAYAGAGGYYFANSIGLAVPMRAIPTAYQVGAWVHTNVSGPANLFPGTNTLGWQIASLNAGQIQQYNQYGEGFVLDARLP